jgi:Ca2+-binding EF-hand superfamily protein
LIAPPPLANKRSAMGLLPGLGGAAAVSETSYQSKASSTAAAIASGRGRSPPPQRNQQQAMSSISERLAAANRGTEMPGAAGAAEAKPGMRTSLVTALDPTDDLELDPRVVGLSFTHVMIRMHRSIYSASEQKLKYLFQFFDVDQDGLISMQDLTTAFTWLFQVPLVQQTEAYEDLPREQRDPVRRAETLMHLWDSDSDQVLNQDEFVEMGRKDPDLLEMLSALRM